MRERVGKSGGRGNFLTYAERAQNAFPNDSILVDVKTISARFGDTLKKSAKAVAAIDRRQGRHESVTYLPAAKKRRQGVIALLRFVKGS